MREIKTCWANNGHTEANKVEGVERVVCVCVYECVQGERVR